MKISWLWLLIAVLAAWAVGFFSHSRLKLQRADDQQTATELRLKNRIQALETQIEKSREGDVQWVNRKAITSGETNLSDQKPSFILQALIGVNDLDVSHEKYRQWRVIYELERLVEIGEQAVPEIQSFLKRNEDVVFHSGISAVQRGARRTGSGRNRLFPHTLREGLIEVLERIGGDAAEASLLEVLRVTGKGGEIASAAHSLEVMKPGKYSQEILTAAKELLSEPVKGDDGIGVDTETRAYLFKILNEFGDDAFLEQAKTQLIFEDGRLDRDALAYVMEQQGETAMESVYNAFQNSDVLNLADRLALAKRGLEYVGMNEHSNEMFYALMRDPQLPATLKSAIAQGMASGNSMVQANPPASSEAIKTRMQLLQTIRGDITHANVAEAIGQAGNQLQLMLEELPTEP